MPEGISQDIEFLPSVESLWLDPKNPRLPTAARDWPQERLLSYVATRHEAILVGRSMSRFGFFVSEPMIVLEEDGHEIVVEGNRRLTALKLLTSEEARSLVESEEWGELSATFKIPERGVPIVRAASREAIAPIIGYRHIAGIQEWDPYPKARFITGFIDDENESFAAVAELVGESEGDVRRLYRNFSVLEQGKRLGLDTSRAEAEFGVFDRVLVGGVREHIGAPPPSSMSERTWPLEDSDTTKERLNETLSWIFGDAEHDAVASDSRALARLSQVLRSSDGTETLRRTRDLAAAEEASGGPRARLLERLGSALASLQASHQDLPDHKDDGDVRELIRSCEEELESLRDVIDD